MPAFHDAEMDRNLDRVIGHCVEAVARLQSALSARSQDNIKRYSKGYHHAFDQLRQSLQEIEPNEQQQEQLRKLELQHRRMMRICQQSMALTREDLALIEQGITKLKQVAVIAEGLSDQSD